MLYFRVFYYHLKLRLIKIIDIRSKSSVSLNELENIVQPRLLEKNIAKIVVGMLEYQLISGTIIRLIRKCIE